MSERHATRVTREPSRRRFLSLSSIQGEIRAQGPDPFALLDDRVRRFYELDRWRGYDQVDLEPYGRLLARAREQARRTVQRRPGEAAALLRSATRFSELLLAVAGEREGPVTERMVG